jgi:hypothetical protein
MTSVLKVDNIQNSSGGFVIPPAGGIIQIQYDQLTTGTSQSVTTQTWNKLTNFPSVTITPTSTTSKLKIDVMWNGEFSGQSDAFNSLFALYKDNTLIVGNTDTGYTMTGMWCPSMSYTGTDNDSTPETMTGTYYDEPNTTSAITYYLAFWPTNSSTIYINRVVNSNTGDGYERMISNMTVTEIAG